MVIGFYYCSQSYRSGVFKIHLIRLRLLQRVKIGIWNKRTENSHPPRFTQKTLTSKKFTLCISNLSSLYSCSCQIKVFKPKGADRKWKTDHDRMHKKSVQEKSKYRPGNSFTPMVKCNPLSDAKGMLVPPPNMEREKAMIVDAAIKVEKHSQSMEDIRTVGENSYNQRSANLSGSGNLSGSCTNLSIGSAANNVTAWLFFRRRDISIEYIDRIWDWKKPCKLLIK